MKSVLLDLLNESAQALRYAAQPFVAGDAAPPTDEWLARLQGRIGPLPDRLNTLTQLASRLPACALDDWSDAHRIFFGEWLTAHFPNEGSAGVIALGDAWQEGLRAGLCANATKPRTTSATGGIEGQMSIRTHSLLIIAADVIEHYLIPAEPDPAPFVALVADMRMVIGQTTVASRVGEAIRLAGPSGGFQ